MRIGTFDVVARRRADHSGQGLQNTAGGHPAHRGPRRHGRRGRWRRRGPAPSGRARGGRHFGTACPARRPRPPRPGLLHDMGEVGPGQDRDGSRPSVPGSGHARSGKGMSRSSSSTRHRCQHRAALEFGMPPVRPGVRRLRETGGRDSTRGRCRRQASCKHLSVQRGHSSTSGT
jgi:hypothetical protein